MVTIAEFAFRPMTLTVTVGTTVSWLNSDEILHTVTSGIARDPGVPGVSEDDPAQPNGLFDGDLDGAGAVFRRTFDTEGRFPYYCDIHAGMAGAVVVID